MENNTPSTSKKSLGNQGAGRGEGVFLEMRREYTGVEARTDERERTEWNFAFNQESNETGWPVVG